MAGSYKKGRRDPGRFIIIPVPVLVSEPYLALGASARALLWDIASQYCGDNNGRLLSGWKFMNEERGWRGKHTLINAKAELLAPGNLVVETRMGKFPSTSAWFGCTWWPLDWCEGMEIAVRDFPRGEYRRREPLKKQSAKNASLGAISAP